MDIKALSVQQPWAWLLSNGFKDIENRNWYMYHRGLLAIHAGKKLGRDQQHDWEYIRRIAPEIQMPQLRDMAYGGFVGTVEVIDCVRHSDSKWFQGEYGIVVRDGKSCRFAPYKGQLGLFKVPRSLIVYG